MMMAALAVAVCAPRVSALTVVSLTGDKDGFGVGCPIASGLDYTDYGAYWADYREAGDPAFTDYWYADDKSWSHTYSLGGMTPASAELELFVAGIADDATWDADVRVNGASVGVIPGIAGASDDTRLLAFGVPTAAITGSSDVTVDVSYSGDGYIIDYSELAIEVVPEPATLGLLAFGLAGLALSRRRRRK